MTSAWVENGPVSLPPRRVAYGAGLVVAALAVAGVALGFHAGWRDGQAPGFGGAAKRASDNGVISATPVVEIAPPVPPAPTAADAAKAAEDAAAAAKAKELAAQTAAAQALQSKTAKPEGNIDDILTSASEKPPAPVKPAAEEAPPPPKSDVPF
jgi:hypothetical protein